MALSGEVVHNAIDGIVVAAAFLVSPLASSITGSTVYADHGAHCMGIGFSELDVPAGSEE